MLMKLTVLEHWDQQVVEYVNTMVLILLKWIFSWEHSPKVLAVLEAMLLLAMYVSLQRISLYMHSILDGVCDYGAMLFCIVRKWV